MIWNRKIWDAKKQLNSCILFVQIDTWIILSMVVGSKMEDKA